MTEVDKAKFERDLARLLRLDVKSVFFKSALQFETVKEERDEARSDLEECRKNSIKALYEKEADFADERMAHQGALSQREREREDLKAQYEDKLEETRRTNAGLNGNVVGLEKRAASLEGEVAGLKAKLDLREEEIHEAAGDSTGDYQTGRCLARKVGERGQAQGGRAGRP